MNKIPVIYDGDMGGDDLWAIAMLLGNLDRFDLLGLTTCHGNVPVTAATKNVLNLLHWLDIKNTPIVQGAVKPHDGVQITGDDAYGTDGVGGVILPESRQKPKEIDCAAWFAQILGARSDVTVICTGPATNIANFLGKHPEKAAKIREIIFMGGALLPPGANLEPVKLESGRFRKGNITEFAEFNAFCDPAALNIILKHNVKFTVLAADATQFMVLTPSRQDKIKRLHETYGPAFHRMLMACAHLDQDKFGVDGPFIHDPNVITYALRPDLYRGTVLPTLQFLERPPEDPHRGEAKETGGKNATAAHWINHITDTDTVFNVMLESLQAVIDKAPKRDG